MKRTLLNMIAALSLASVAVGSPTPDQKILVLKNKDGVALRGCDAVAYFTDHKAVKGNPQCQSEYEGATFYFASAEHKALFDAKPAKYAPAYGGYGGYAASVNKIKPGNPKLWSIVDGRLILQHTKAAVTLWNKDVQASLEQADRNWPGLMEREMSRSVASSKHPLTWSVLYDHGDTRQQIIVQAPRGAPAAAQGEGVSPMPGDLAWPGF